MMGSARFSNKGIFLFFMQWWRVHLIIKSEYIDDIDISDIKETGFFQSNVDKGNLHSRENFSDPTLVNISHNALVGFVFNKQFRDLMVFHQRNTDFSLVGIYQYFRRHGCPVLDKVIGKL